jgi:hypothetical protein
VPRAVAVENVTHRLGSLLRRIFNTAYVFGSPGLLYRARKLLSWAFKAAAAQWAAFNLASPFCARPSGIAPWARSWANERPYPLQSITADADRVSTVGLIFRPHADEMLCLARRRRLCTRGVDAEGRGAARRKASQRSKLDL